MIELYKYEHFHLINYYDNKTNDKINNFLFNFSMKND